MCRTMSRDSATYVDITKVYIIAPLIKVILLLYTLQIMHPILVEWDKVQHCLWLKVTLIHSYHLATTVEPRLMDTPQQRTTTI